jgi:hypothetical protein
MDLEVFCLEEDAQVAVRPGCGRQLTEWGNFDVLGVQRAIYPPRRGIVSMLTKTVVLIEII